MFQHQCATQQLPAVLIGIADRRETPGEDRLDHARSSVRNGRTIATFFDDFDHLGQFELAYVAQSARNQSAAEAAFSRLFPKSQIKGGGG